MSTHFLPTSLIATLAAACSAPGAPTTALIESAVLEGTKDGATMNVVVALDQPLSGSPRDLWPWMDDIAVAQDSALTCAGLGTGEVVERYDAIPMLELLLDAQGVEALSHCAGVVSLGADHEVVPDLAQSIPLIDADVVHAADGFTGTGVGVAIIDTGIDTGHTAFAGRIVHTMDVADGDSDPSDCGSHGTNVSAIAAGSAGVAPDADILSYKVFPDATCDSASSADVRAALNDIAANIDTYNIASVNMSLGSHAIDGSGWSSDCSSEVSSFTAAIQAVAAAGVVVVTSAGNSALTDEVGYPACLDSTVTVAASDNFDTIAYFSDGGDMIDLAAPGVSITAAGITMSGTSQAAPHVTGAVALLAQAAPDASADELVDALTASWDSVTDDRGTTTHVYPRLNIADSVDVLGAPEDPITQAELTFVPFNWNSGINPAMVLVNGHPLPETTTRYPDFEEVRIDVSDYVYTLDHATVGMWEHADGWFYATEVSITDSDGTGGLEFRAAPGPRDVGMWSHGGTDGGDESSIGWTPTTTTAAVTLDIDLFNVPSSTDVQVLVNGTQVNTTPEAWSTGAYSLSLDVTGYAESAEGNRITIRAEDDIDGWARAVSMTDEAGTVDYAAASAGAYDYGDWSHFGLTAVRPDLPFVSFVDPAVSDSASVAFTAYDFDAAHAGALVVNGGWVRVEDQLWADGTEVVLDVTGFVEDEDRTLVSWWLLDDDALRVADLAIVGEAERTLEFEALEGDEGSTVLVAHPLAGGLPGRTWFYDAPSVPQGMICGLYNTAQDGAYAETCRGHDAAVSCPEGYIQRNGGDWGAPYGEGFYWCEAEGTCSGAGCDLSTVPEGTVCGLWHSTNMASIDVTCMGESVSTGSCPSGFTYYAMGDQGRPSGQGYSWCQLDSTGCSGEDCLTPEFSDFVCGLSHEARTANSCQGSDPLTESCPAGFADAWGGDMGMPSGQGYAWCTVE